MENLVFSIANFAISKDILGPNKRLILWLQGCNRDFPCEGCQTPEYQKIKQNNCSKKQLNLIFNEAVKQGIQGVTISGGEPFLQTSAIRFLGSLISAHNEKTKGNMDLLVYTGYLYEEIKNKHKGTIKYIDVLIDGPYIKDLDVGEGLKGSSNQNLLFLSSRAQTLKVKFLNLLKERKSSVLFANGRFISVGLKNNK